MLVRPGRRGVRVAERRGLPGSRVLTVMTSTPGAALPRFGIAGWLFVAAAACAGDVADEAPPPEPRDVAVRTPEAVGPPDRRAAEQGDAGAQARLAEAHYLGLGATQDFDEALRWARLAAGQGNARGQGVLAAAYNTGRGVEQDYDEALRWARLAAGQGDAWGQSVLANFYVDGRGVEQDFEEAVRLLRLGAEQGDPDSQTGLGMMRMAGRGVEQDYVSAYMWLSLGASGPGISSGGALDLLKQVMTPEQISEAEARARDWEAGAPVR